MRSSVRPWDTSPRTSEYRHGASQGHGEGPPRWGSDSGRSRCKSDVHQQGGDRHVQPAGIKQRLSDSDRKLHRAIDRLRQHGQRGGAGGQPGLRAVALGASRALRGHARVISLRVVCSDVSCPLAPRSRTRSAPSAAADHKPQSRHASCLFPQRPQPAPPPSGSPDRACGTLPRGTRCRSRNPRRSSTRRHAARHNRAAILFRRTSWRAMRSIRRCSSDSFVQPMQLMRAIALAGQVHGVRRFSPCAAPVRGYVAEAMQFDFLTLVALVALVLALVLQIVATRRVTGDASFAPEQRSRQLWLIWLVPILGAALVLAVLRDEPPERGDRQAQKDA